MSDRDYTHDRLSYMMLCVIVQAVKDAFFTKEREAKTLRSGKRSKANGAEYERRQAIHWLTSDPDFWVVCDMAKVSGSKIRQKARELVELTKEERRQRVNDLMRDCYEWNKSSANKGISKRYL